MIDIDDYLLFVDEALDGMIEVIAELGDTLANQRPDTPGTNSPFALLTHCLGVMEYWVGHVVAGRSVHRDRDAEFGATGAVDEHVARIRRTRRQLDADSWRARGPQGAATARGAPRAAGDEHSDRPVARGRRSAGGR